MNIKNDEKRQAQQLLLQGKKPKEVAAVLDVHISTIYNWKKELVFENTETYSKKNETRNETKKEYENEFENKINYNDLEKEKIKLSKENELLKAKVQQLERVVADLVIKLKQQHPDWLD